MGQYYIWGEYINLPDGLDQYIQIEKEFDEHLQDTLRRFDENARYFAEPKDSIFNLKFVIEQKLSDGIRFLSKNGIYDLSVEDYFSYSDSYAKMLDVVSQYYTYAENIAEKQAYIERHSIAQAEAEAKSTITGLGFGILSSSFTAHMVYAMQNESKIRKQTAEAQKRFDEATARIKSSTGSKITEECEGLYRKYFVPNFRNLIISFWAECFALYLQKAEAIYSFGVSDIANQNYSISKSNQLIENAYTTDKKAQIISALRYCPYNFEIYRFAEKNGLFCEELKNILLLLGMSYDYEESKKPKKSSADEEITNEAIRMLLENQIDIEDSHWKTRATSYLAASKKLAEKYPNSYVPHGLVAVHTIAAHLKDRNGLFWLDIRSSLDKMFSVYKKNDPLSDLWSSITERFVEYSDFFVNAAKEYITEQDESFSRQNPDANLVASENHDWVSKSNYKTLIGTAVYPLYKIIKGFEEKGVSEDEWQFDFFKAGLLKIVCEFLKPYDMCYGYPGKWVRIQVPLSERQEALRIYDELVAQGVEGSEEFQIYKDKAYVYNTAFGDTRNTVWRGDITKAGRAAQGKLTPEEQADNNKKMGLGALVMAIGFSFTFAVNVATDGSGFGSFIWFALGIFCWIATVLFLKD